MRTRSIVLQMILNILSYFFSSELYVMLLEKIMQVNTHLNHQYRTALTSSVCGVLCLHLSSLFWPDGNVPLERFDRILNETERRLSMLRGSVESPALGSKIQRLQSAAEEQQSRLSLIELDITEIREERDSLRDIAFNLPQSCPQATGESKG